MYFIFGNFCRRASIPSILFFEFHVEGKKNKDKKSIAADLHPQG